MEPDGRHIAYYLPGKVVNQVKLTEELQNRGFYKESNGILTSKDGSIPVTIELLLIKDSLDFIKEEQKDLSSNFKVETVISLDDDIENQLDIFEPQYTNAGIIDWQYYQTLKSNSTNTISGSQMFISEKLYKPKTNQGYNLTEIYKSKNQNVTVFEDRITQINFNSFRKPTIGVYKYYLVFLDYCYALKERIEYELELFHETTTLTVNPPTMKSDFASICSMRENLIHKGGFNLSIYELSAEIVIKGNKTKRLVEYFDSGLNQICEWVDECYGVMIDAL